MAAPKTGPTGKLKIDADQVEKMAMIGCPVTDIALILGCSTDTLHRRFAAEIAKGRGKCRSRLRQLAFQSAERGNIAMQIFLLKNMCDMSDKIEEVSTTRFPDTDILNAAGSKD